MNLLTSFPVVSFNGNEKLLLRVCTANGGFRSALLSDAELIARGEELDLPLFRLLTPYNSIAATRTPTIIKGRYLEFLINRLNFFDLFLDPEKDEVLSSRVAVSADETSDK